MASWRIIEGDCREVLREMPDESVQCCVTSPPYFGLRDYGHDGQLGLEPTPDEYVAALVETFREVRRVLRDDGTLWLNLGDSYAANGGHTREGTTSQRVGRANLRQQNRGTTNCPAGFKPKDLMGIPWRVALALQEDGWYLRSDIIWAKRSCTPESVRDRPTRAHEYLFLLTARPRYFYDAAAIAEPMASLDPEHPSYRPNLVELADNGGRRERTGGKNENTFNGVRGGLRNKRSVWNVAPQPYADAHFAMFPPKLIEPCVLAGAPSGGVVLDPFAGAGTTGLVALRHGRSFVGVELNPEYVEMARRRIIDDAPLLNQWCEDPAPLTSKDETAPPSSSLTAGNEAA